ncbi:hypothetical protein M413DRAFT_441656 [Hebeloma cylindrosporum]|uniref:F-box domain-containing protein n=1 Tax=Hebeloma cylindrosporum TaxID=76867 RepID=A0A0C3CCR7_HEBCY|nr:hypothetical protein M413DRAFT_441656 [Hebeloma cylindrosporum h7]
MGSYPGINDLGSVLNALSGTPHRCPSQSNVGRMCDDCSKLEDIDREIADTLSNLAKRRRALISKINQNHDPYSHRLPSEIASQIFMFYKDSIVNSEAQKTAMPIPYTDPLGSLLQVATVCKTWREIMFATPDLWTTINIFAYAIPISLHAELAEQWLSRSGALPLCITVYCNPYLGYNTEREIHPDELSPLFEILRRYNTQWRKLTLYIPTDFYSSFQGDLTGAPILETFRLLPPEEFTTNFHQLLLPDTPQLVNLEISSPRLIDIKLEWNGLTHFEAEAVSVDEILYLLQWAPFLVLFKAGGVNDLEVYGIPDKPITHLSLKELHFAPDVDLEGINILFDRLLLPALEHFVYVAPMVIHFPTAVLCSLFHRSRCPLTHFTFIGPLEKRPRFDDSHVIGLLETVSTITHLQLQKLFFSDGATPPPPPVIVPEHLVQCALDIEVTVEPYKPPVDIELQPGIQRRTTSLIRREPGTPHSKS